MGGSCSKALIQGGIIHEKMFREWGGSEVQVAIAQRGFPDGGREQLSGK